MKYTFALLILFTASIFGQSEKYQNLISDSKAIGLKPLNAIENRETLVAGMKKSAGLAILYSLALPGMGELYAGNYETGKYLTIAEVTLWGLAGGFSYYSKIQEDNYKQFAKTNAGVNSTDKDKDFYGIVANYTSLEDYNNEKASYGQFSEMLDPAKYNFKWNTQTERKDYRGLWVSSEQATNNVRFVIGGMILNRVVSAINAVRLVSAYNKQVELTWNLYFDYSVLPQSRNSITLNFIKLF